MTANELADEVMEHYRAELPRGFNVNWMQEAATMLRQQQAEIGALKQIIDANNLNQNIGQFVKPANEPYLTDEKIWKLWQTHLNDDITVFVRAILKKASEK